MNELEEYKKELFEEHKKTVEGRTINEYNKLVDLRNKYGLQSQGHALLHQARYFLVGDLADTDKITKLHFKNEDPNCAGTSSYCVECVEYQRHIANSKESKQDE